MLILTRRVGESVMVGDDVVVTVKQIKGNQISLGIEAPNRTDIHREEIYRQIHRCGVPKARVKKQRTIDAGLHR